MGSRGTHVALIDEARDTVPDHEVRRVQLPQSESINEDISVDELRPYGCFAVGGAGGPYVALSGPWGGAEFRHLVPPVAPGCGDPHIQPFTGLHQLYLPALGKPPQLVGIFFDADEDPSSRGVQADHHLVAIDPRPTRDRRARNANRGVISFHGVDLVDPFRILLADDLEGRAREG